MAHYFLELFKLISCCRTFNTVCFSRFDFSLKVFDKKIFFTFSVVSFIWELRLTYRIYIQYIYICDERLVWGSLRLVPIKPWCVLCGIYMYILQTCVLTFRQEKTFIIIYNCLCQTAKVTIDFLSICISLSLPSSLPLPFSLSLFPYYSPTYRPSLVYTHKHCNTSYHHGAIRSIS